MLVVTPGIDLKPLTGGADYVFVLDVSGSMQGRKIQTLGARGRQGARPAAARPTASASSPSRRRARELTSAGPRRRPRTSRRATRTVDGAHRRRVAPTSTTAMRAGAAGPRRGPRHQHRARHRRRDQHRAWWTRGASRPSLQPARRPRLRLPHRQQRELAADARWWPRRAAASTPAMSNEDDILGQLLLAKSKIAHGGAPRRDAQGLGRQGLRRDRRERSPRSTAASSSSSSGATSGAGRRRYAQGAGSPARTRPTRRRSTSPTSMHRHPELERLWALERVEALEALERAGPHPDRRGARRASASSASPTSSSPTRPRWSCSATRASSARGIERRNRERVAVERQAQAARAAQPAPSYHVDRQSQPMFNQPAPSAGGSRGGGAFDPLTAGLAAALAGLAWASRRGRGGRS